MPPNQDGRGAGDSFETRAIHAGQSPDPATGAVVTPITLATTFAQRAVGEHSGYEYARSANPTRAAMEACIASLEGAAHGLGFASGLAAEDALLRRLRPGDHVIIPNDAYGGTFRLVARVHEPGGLSWSAVDLTDLDAIEAAWRDERRMDRDADEPVAHGRRHRSGGAARARAGRDRRG
jgi:cystathionine gamma-synthase